MNINNLRKLMSQNTSQQVIKLMENSYSNILKNHEAALKHATGLMNEHVTKINLLQSYFADIDFLNKSVLKAGQHSITSHIDVLIKNIPERFDFENESYQEKVQEKLAEVIDEIPYPEIRASKEVDNSFSQIAFAGLVLAMVTGAKNFDGNDKTIYCICCLLAIILIVDNNIKNNPQ